MTEEQYTDYLRLAGERARAKVDAMLAADRPLNVDEPTQRDIDAVKRALEKGRDQARHYLIRKWHGKKNAP
jgi:hypothetical protein